jgi:hypothetical protein
MFNLLKFTTMKKVLGILVIGLAAYGTYGLFVDIKGLIAKKKAAKLAAAKPAPVAAKKV